MQRIATSTVEADKFGTGRNGFTYGDPGSLVPPTEISELWLDSVQEALANTVELDGKTLDQTDYFQVADTVLGMLRDALSVSRGFVATGLEWTVTSGLSANLSAGVFYASGRRQTVVTVAASDTPRTFTNNSTRYVYIGPHATDERAYTITDAATPQTDPDLCLTAIIVTSGGAITSITNFSTFVGGGQPLVELGAGRVLQLRPGSNSSFLGLVTTQADGITGRWSAVNATKFNYGAPQTSGSTSRREKEHTFDQKNFTGAGSQDTIILNTAGRSDNDTATITLTVSGRRTDSPNFGYTLKYVIGANFNTGAWAFNGLATVIHEDGDGGGARTVRCQLDGSNRVVIRYNLTGAETWEFSTDVEIVYNYA